MRGRPVEGPLRAVMSPTVTRRSPDRHRAVVRAPRTWNTHDRCGIPPMCPDRVTGQSSPLRSFPTPQRRRARMLGAAPLATLAPCPLKKRSARSLTHVRVGDCMHPGLLTCGADDSLRHVATIMANHRVHAVVVMSAGGARPVGVVSDLDVVAALAVGADCAAGEVAATETLTVSANEPLRSAAQLMSEHAVSHLVVIDGAGGYPLGVLSTLDIASVYADELTVAADVIDERAFRRGEISTGARGRRRPARRGNGARATCPDRRRPGDSRVPRGRLAGVDRVPVLRRGQPRLGHRRGRSTSTTRTASGWSSRAGARASIVAHAAYVRIDATRAEVAFLVADAWQGRGISTILLAHLAEAAEQHGITTFVARGAAAQPPDDRRLPRERLPGRAPLDAGCARDRAADVAVSGGARAVRGARADRCGRGGAELPRAALGGGDRRLAAAGDDRRRDPAQPARGRVQRARCTRSTTRPTVVQSLPAYRSVGDIPGGVELAVVAVPAEQVVGGRTRVRGRRGAGLLVISAGFAETGAEGASRQRELLDVCRDAGIRIVGPELPGRAQHRRRTCG